MANNDGTGRGFTVHERYSRGQPGNTTNARSASSISGARTVQERSTRRPQFECCDDPFVTVHEVEAPPQRPQFECFECCDCFVAVVHCTL